MFSIPEESSSSIQPLVYPACCSIIPEESSSSIQPLVPACCSSIPEESCSITQPLVYTACSIISEESSSSSIIPEESCSITQPLVYTACSIISEESSSSSIIPEESCSITQPLQHPGGELQQHHPASGLHGLQHHPEPLVPACSIIPEESGCSILHPLVPSSACSSIMTSGELMQSAPLLSHRSKRSVLYKSLCFLLLVFQGGVLDFYLINFTDLYWCSWIATDLVVISGWGIFFAKNARSKRERACGFHQKSSMFGCNLGEFTYAYLAWLIYVIACTPKVVLILETSILDLIELQVPCGVTGFKVIVLLSAPLLFCLINSIIEDLNGATRHRSTSCFLGTCMDLLDSFTLVEMLLRSEIPDPYLKYTVISVHFVVLSVPVIWLYELSASEMRCRWLCARFITGLLVNAPLLVVRCFQVYVYRMQVSVFMFKNIFFLACRLLELVEQCAAVRGVRRLNGGRDQAQFSHCVSENDMCPHGYVNTLAVTQS
ncbi:transmembrane protein 121B [Sebastes fasciatus]|uniref:transmembrane protein 121B n=1 Tax=Sebastes fasciatus TaxID=394691 RepID=UPI003D9ED725